MNQALILHGTGSHPHDNWFWWLKEELEKADYRVWLPQLPGAEKPNPNRYLPFLLNEIGLQFNQDTIIIGHSSGAVAALYLLQNLPPKTRVACVYLVGVFKDDLGWEKLKELFPYPFDFSKIKASCQKFVFIHADDDPHCPLAGAQFLHDQLGGDFVLLPGQKHFSISTAGEKYRQFPKLLQLISDRDQKSLL